MTISQAYNDFKNALEKIYPTREAETITQWIFENVTRLKKWEIKNSKENIPDAHYQTLLQYVEQLMLHTPVQYVLHEAWFYKRKFFVNENVLIPRPETEELVEWIVNDFKNIPTATTLQIIDIGTGSGCIPISIKKELPQPQVFAIDVSESALDVAKKNAKDLEADVQFFQMNFLNENEWKPLPAYDCIVSNPPYIPIAEKEILDKNVTNFEPGIALFVEDIRPFIFYEKIALFAQSHLQPTGKIFVEVHEAYAKSIQQIFENTGFKTEIKKDFYGKERMVGATFI